LLSEARVGISLVELLGQINVKPEQIKYVGISHYHGDHIGQVSSFPKATLSGCRPTNSARLL
jgi:glyoxylase-like metal-dependent hydrolase (beta-lactamase superfamily II)